MPPKGKSQPTQPTVPPPPTIQYTLDHTTKFPLFSEASVLSFNLSVQEKEGKNSKKGSVSDIDWAECVEKNWLHIKQDFVKELYASYNSTEEAATNDNNDFESQNVTQNVPQNESSIDSLNNSLSDSMQENESKQRWESTYETTSSTIDSERFSIEWRAMNRMTRVYSSTVEHPYPDTFNQTNSVDIDTSQVIDEELLKDATANDIDQLDLYTKYCTDFRLPDTTDSPFLHEAMKPFLSSLYFIMQNQKQLNVSIGFGHFLWELIYPKRDLNSQLPMENEVYLVKLWHNEAWRLIAVDSKMPYRLSSKQLQMPQTKKYEYWPTIIYKALMVLSGSESAMDTRSELLFRDPLWCLQALLGPYTPRSYYSANSLQAMKVIRGTLEEEKNMAQNVNQLLTLYSKRKYIHGKNLIEQGKTSDALAGKIVNQITDAPDYNQNNLAICATCVSPSHILSLSPRDCEYYLEVGLDPLTLYQITEMKYLSGKIALHLVAFNQTVDWKGELSYNDSELWTADFESQIGFARQNRFIHNQNSVLPLKDFWIPYESFQQYFESIHVLQNISQLEKKASLFAENLHTNFFLEVSPDITELYFSTYYLRDEELAVAAHDDPKAKKGKKEVAPVPVSISDECNPTEVISLVVETWDWKEKSVPQRLAYISTYQLYKNLFRVSLPTLKSNQQNHYLKIFLEGGHSKRTELCCYVPKDASSSSLQVGTSQDTLTRLGVNHVQFEPQVFPSLECNQWKILFMYEIINTRNAWFGAKISFLNRHNETNESSKISQILPFVDMILMNNITKEVYRPSIPGSISPIELQIDEANLDVKGKQGPIGSYALVAVVKSKEELIPEDEYTLELLYEESAVTISPVENFQYYSHEGTYVPNLSRELFNYIIWSGEEAYTSMHVKIDRNVPITLQVENEIGTVLYTSFIDQRREMRLHISTPPLKTEPSQKNQEKCVIVRAFVDESYNHRMIYHVQREEQRSLFHNRVETTPVEEVPEIADKRDDKASKKQTATKAKGGKGKQSDNSRQIKIPAKQTEPQFVSTIPNTLPPGTEATQLELNPDFVKYQVNFCFTTPNIIIEECSTRALKISQFMEALEEEEAGRLEKGVKQREVFFKQRAHDFNVNGRVNPEIIEKPIWKNNNFQGKWLAKCRGLKVIEDDQVEGRELRIVHDITTLIQEHEAMHSANKSDSTEVKSTIKGCQLIELHERLLSDTKEFISLYESKHRDRASYHATIQQEVEQKLNDIEKRKIEIQKNMKKGKK